MDERARAMIHDLIIAIMEGRETTESEPVPRSISTTKFRAAIRKAIAANRPTPAIDFFPPSPTGDDDQ